MNIWKHVLAYYAGALVFGAVGLWVYPFFVHAGYPAGDDQGYRFELVEFTILTAIAAVFFALMLSFRVAITTEPDEMPATRDYGWPNFWVGAAFGSLIVIGQALGCWLGIAGPQRPDLERLYWLAANWLFLPLLCGEAAFHSVRVRSHKRGFPVIQHTKQSDN